MSGVIDNNGVQWEHCNQCGGWEVVGELYYEPCNTKLPLPSWAKANCWERMSENADICRSCHRGIPWVGKYRDKYMNEYDAMTAEEKQAWLGKFMKK